MIATTRFEDDIRYARVICEDAKDATTPRVERFEERIRRLAELRLKEYRIVLAHLQFMLEGQEEFFFHDLTRQLFSTSHITPFMIGQKMDEITNRIAEIEDILR